MKKTGNILKMRSFIDKEVQYQLPIGADLIFMNELIGKKISIKYLNIINCIHCGKKTKTSFAQGYCYKCFKTLPQTDAGILKPELDQSHLGISRDMKWAKENSLKPHYVYLALSSHVKVGVTRETQVPTRWIDQGASKAIKLAFTPNRHIAGVIEVALKEHFSDKTNWRNMLKNIINKDVNLLKEKNKALSLLHPELKQYLCKQDDILEIEFPVTKYPSKVSSINIDKEIEYSGILVGIKGQYLIFDDDKVINIRKYAGYLFEIESA